MKDITRRVERLEAAAPPGGHTWQEIAMEHRRLGAEAREIVEAALDGRPAPKRATSFLDTCGCAGCPTDRATPRGGVRERLIRRLDAMAAAGGGA